MWERMEIRLPYSTEEKKQENEAAILEALLFLSGEPLADEKIRAHTGWSLQKIERAARKLQDTLQAYGSGLTVLRAAGGYQLVTDAKLHEKIRWVRTEQRELTNAALEVLSIIAFKQPVIRADIEKLRGVSSERVIGTLLQQGLILEVGRKETPGRPIMYGTSPFFLTCMGVESMQELMRQVGTFTDNATGVKHIKNNILQTANEESGNGKIAKSNE